MVVYECVSRDEAWTGSSGKFVEAKWARISKGSEACPEIRLILVARELGCLERLDEFSAGTPSLTVVKLLVSVADERDLTVMLFDVAWRCTNMRRLRKALRGTIEAPQIWSGTGKAAMINWGSRRARPTRWCIGTSILGCRCLCTTMVSCS